MPYTTEQLNTLNEAIALGALTVKYADKEVVYRSLPDMLRVKSLMEADLGQPKANRKALIEYDRGF